MLEHVDPQYGKSHSHTPAAVHVPCPEHGGSLKRSHSASVALTSSLSVRSLAVQLRSSSCEKMTDAEFLSMNLTPATETVGEPEDIPKHEDEESFWKRQ